MKYLSSLPACNTQWDISVPSFSTWAKAAPKIFFLVDKRCLLLPKINPFIPAKLAEVGDVTHLSKSCHVGILTLQLEQIVDS